MRNDALIVFSFDIPTARRVGSPDYPEAVGRLKNLVEEVRAAENADWDEEIKWSGPRHLHPSKYDNTLGVTVYHPDGDSSRLRVESDGYPNVVYLCRILRYIVSNYNLRPIAFSWASRLGNTDGGGAAFVTRDRVQMMDSEGWLSRRYDLYTK